MDMPEIYMRALVKKSFPAARYWGAGLSSLQSKNGIVWGTLTLADRKSAGYGGNDDADLINMISAIDGNKVGMIFVEQSRQSCQDLLACHSKRASMCHKWQNTSKVAVMPRPQEQISRAI